MKKMWEGRFNKETDKLLEKFNASITFDKRMYEEDIKLKMELLSSKLKTKIFICQLKKD